MFFLEEVRAMTMAVLFLEVRWPSGCSDRSSSPTQGFGQNPKFNPRTRAPELAPVRVRTETPNPTVPTEPVGQQASNARLHARTRKYPTVFIRNIGFKRGIQPDRTSFCPTQPVGRKALSNQVRA